MAKQYSHFMLCGVYTHCNRSFRHINDFTWWQHGHYWTARSWAEACISSLCNFVTRCTLLFNHLHYHVSCHPHIQATRKRLCQRPARKAFGWINNSFSVHIGHLGLLLLCPLLCAPKRTQKLCTSNICCDVPASNSFCHSPASIIRWSHMDYFQHSASASFGGQYLGVVAWFCMPSTFELDGNAYLFICLFISSHF